MYKCLSFPSQSASPKVMQYLRQKRPIGCKVEGGDYDDSDSNHDDEPSQKQTKVAGLGPIFASTRVTKRLSVQGSPTAARLQRCLHHTNEFVVNLSSDDDFHAPLSKPKKEVLAHLLVQADHTLASASLERTIQTTIVPQRREHHAVLLQT